MLQTKPRRRADGDRCARPTQSAVSAITRRLAALGVTADVRRCGSRLTATGVTAQVDLQAVLGGGTPLPREVALVNAALRAGVPVTVGIDDAVGAAGSPGVVPFRERFCAFLERAGIDRRLLGLSLAAGELPDARCRSTLRPLLGEGPRYVLLPSDGGASERAGLEGVWPLLQRCEAHGPRFWPAHRAGVRSRCPLLPSESSMALLPGLGIAAPRNSAWLPLRFDICRLSDERGRIRDALLARVLDACVDLGDRLLDHLTWFDPRQRLDAYCNRRLAVCVSGFGDLIVKRGENPSDWQSLRRLDRLVSRLHDGLWARSKRLSDERGPLPALLEREPEWSWCDEAHSRDWRARWRAALAAEQVRHRNLLVLSPYAILPHDGSAGIEFADLLPALTHADAFSFSAPPALGHWRASDFRAFHRRLQALVAHHNAASFVATGV